MIIFLHGPDDYRREEKKREILAEFRNRHPNFGLMTFSFGEGFAPGGDLLEFERFQEFLANQSLFQVAKMAVLENSFEAFSDMRHETRDMFKSELGNILNSKNVTILISEREKPVKAMDFLLKEPVMTQEFRFLEGREWEVFILKEAERLDVKITLTSLRFLASVYQNNTWSLVTELEKVAGLGKEVVDVKDLENLGIEQAPIFWSLILGFKSRNLEQKLWALEKILGSNEQPAKIFNILAYQLPAKLQDLARYDLMVKSGKLEYEEALLELAISQ